MIVLEIKIDDNTLEKIEHLVVTSRNCHELIDQHLVHGEDLLNIHDTIRYTNMELDNIKKEIINQCGAIDKNKLTCTISEGKAYVLKG